MIVNVAGIYLRWGIVVVDNKCRLSCNMPRCPTKGSRDSHDSLGHDSEEEPALAQL